MMRCDEDDRPKQQRAILVEAVYFHAGVEDWEVRHVVLHETKCLSEVGSHGGNFGKECVLSEQVRDLETIQTITLEILKRHLR